MTPHESVCASASASPLEARPDIQALPEVDLSTDFYEAEVQRDLNMLNREITRKEQAKKGLSNKLAMSIFW